MKDPGEGPPPPDGPAGDGPGTGPEADAGAGPEADGRTGAEGSRTEPTVPEAVLDRSELGTAPGRRPGVLRRLYDWVLHWAHTPHGAWALFLLAVAESSVFPIPPDPLLMALCLGIPARSFRFAGIATLGSVLGGLIGYSIGAGAWAAVDQLFYAWIPGVSPEAFLDIQALYDRYDFWAVFLAGLTPIPYKIFTLSAGIFQINLAIFVVASVLSRGLRFYVVAGLIRRFGAPITRFIDRYFDILSVVFGLLLVGGFLVVEFLL